MHETSQKFHIEPQYLYRATDSIYSPENQERVKQEIDTAITRKREAHLMEQAAEEKSKITYNLELDFGVYQTLYQFKDERSSAYRDARDSLNSFTEMQLQTALGERYHAGLSKFNYDLRDGEIYGENGSEPVIKMFERGRDYRKLHGSKDTEREEAEVVGFRKVQEVLGDENTALGTMMVSFSPPGEGESIYKHNFYDVFTLQEKEGTRYIEARRYSSALSDEEYAKYRRELDPSALFPVMPKDADYLANPIQIQPEGKFGTPNELHNYLHREHGSLTEEELEEIFTTCNNLRLSYINTLCDSPYDEDFAGLNFNAMVVASDEKAKEIKQRKNGVQVVYQQKRVFASVYDEVRFLGRQQIDEVDTGCGRFGGYAMGSDAGYGQGYGPAMTLRGPFSVIEFAVSFSSGEDRYGKRDFECPSCKKTNTRPYNELLKKCQHCGSTKVAC